jgi:cell wall-associated NlpC family hydrolase
MHWANKYIDIPFAECGRSEKGADCWGLVCLVYCNELNICLPDFAGMYATCKDQGRISRLIDQQRPVWQRVPEGEQREFDLICIRIQNRPWHVGIVLNQTDMIHALDGAGVVIEPYCGPVWKNCIDGFYRWVLAR